MDGFCSARSGTIPPLPWPNFPPPFSTAWKNKPAKGTVTVTRSCICGDASVDCNSGVACSDSSVPQIQITILASNTWSDTLTSTIFKSGIEQTQKQVVRVR